MRPLGLAVTVFSACFLLLASAGPAAAATDVSCGQQIRDPGLYNVQPKPRMRSERGHQDLDGECHDRHAGSHAHGRYGRRRVQHLLLRRGRAIGDQERDDPGSHRWHRHLRLHRGSVDLWRVGRTAGPDDHQEPQWRLHVGWPRSGRAQSFPPTVWAMGNSRVRGAQVEQQDHRKRHRGHRVASGRLHQNDFIARNGTGIINDIGAAVTDNLLINNRGNGLTIYGTEFYAPGTTVIGNFDSGTAAMASGRSIRWASAVGTAAEMDPRRNAGTFSARRLTGR